MPEVGTNRSLGGLICNVTAILESAQAVEYDSALFRDGCSLLLRLLEQLFLCGEMVL